MLFSKWNDGQNNKKNRNYSLTKHHSMTYICSNMSFVLSLTETQVNSFVTFDISVALVWVNAQLSLWFEAFLVFCVWNSIVYKGLFCSFALFKGDAWFLQRMTL